MKLIKENGNKWWRYFVYCLEDAILLWLQFFSVQFSSVHSLISVQLFATLWTAACQASLSITNSQCCWNTRPLISWCHPTMPSSIALFCSSLQSFPASGPFLMSQFLASGSQSTGFLASASILPMNIQDWFPSALTGLILQSKEPSGVYFNTTVQKHTLFGLWLSLWSNSHIHTWLLEKQ